MGDSIGGHADKWKMLVHLRCIAVPIERTRTSTSSGEMWKEPPPKTKADDQSLEDIIIAIMSHNVPWARPNLRRSSRTQEREWPVELWWTEFNPELSDFLNKTALDQKRLGVFEAIGIELSCSRKKGERCILFTSDCGCGRNIKPTEQRWIQSL
jgi:hypothetical protein